LLVSIDKIIKTRARCLGLGRAIVFQRLIKQWDNLLAGVLGKRIKGKTCLDKIENKTLVIDCLNSVWASELRLKEKTILKEIKKRFKESNVEKIRFIS